MALMKRRKSLLTSKIFFDTDCISAFLWVNKQSILEALYPNGIVIPREVYDEIDKPSISHLKRRVDTLISKNVASIEDMNIVSPEYTLFRELTTSSGNNKIIGKGEAAAISLAKKHNGIIGSNNLSDISEYVKQFSLTHLTTGDIMLIAFEKGLITEDQGNNIWADMLSKRRRLGANSFSDFINNKKQL